MRVFGKVFLGLTIVLLFAFGLRAFLVSQYLEIKTIHFNISESPESNMYVEEVRESVEPLAEHLRGLPIWSLSLRDFFADISQDSRVEGLRLQRRWPDRIQIDLELKPTKLLLLYKKKFFPVAEDASLLPEVLNEHLASLPILQGKNFYDKKELREKAIKLIQQLPELEHLNANTLSEIRHSKKEGFVLYLSNHHAKVKIGDEFFSRRAMMVNKVLNYLTHEKLRARVIDARYSKKVVVKLRNRS